MDIGSCPRSHSSKVKNEFTFGMDAAVAANDTAKVNELNRIKVDFERIVSRVITQLLTSEDTVLAPY